jgi:undecaprenyl-diphosphatase
MNFARFPWALTGVLLALSGAAAHAGGGPFGIDHEWSPDQSGIWARPVQTGLEYGVIAVEATGALWFGNDDELGHVFWQTVDSSAISGIAAEGLRRAVSRARPDQGDNPKSLTRFGAPGPENETADDE